MHTSHVEASAPSLIDPRGPQFTAALTSVVLAAVLLTAPGPLATVLLGAPGASLFARRGLARRHPHAARLAVPHGWSARVSARPRTSRTPAPPQFAQAVGFAFAIVGLIGFLSGATVVGLVATGLALGAALLNAVFGFCLGCEIYLLALRAGVPSAGRSATRTTT